MSNGSGDTAVRPKNRLADEASAYLLQHAHNPVDWRPWGEDALATAAREDKPLLVSIGYSACHWCHVMERESFEDASTAALMNELFIPVKVDREERPDIDQIYMDAVVRLTGRGGWPLTVFCMPDGRPFYGGTYYPDEPRHGMPSFKQVLESISDAYRNRRGEAEAAAGQILEALDPQIEGEANGLPGIEQVRSGARLIMRGADRQHGGFGIQGPKFPTPTNLELLLASLDFLPADEAQEVGRHLAATARAMARRGLYDHIAGGFHRYCTDPAWTIPHFEKMLYDQGLLMRFYAELARRSTDDRDLVWPLRETAAFLRREMSSPEGGWYASQDADAEGEEGAYNVWTPAQIEGVLGERAPAFMRAYSVTPEGNFEHGTSHLVDIAGEPRAHFGEEREALRPVRDARVAPDTDRKRVTAWNGYTISGLARAASLLDDDTMLEEARAGMDFILEQLVDDAGRLHRIFNRGLPSVPAFLDDHAAVLDACLDLHRAGAGHDYLTAALHFGGEIGERFFDAAAGQLYFTPVDGSALVHRPRTDHDGATPSAEGLAAVGLTRLGALSGYAAISAMAERIVAGRALEIERAPHALPTLLRALALQLRGLAVAVVIGAPDAAETRALAARARRVLLPEDAVIVVAPDAPVPQGLAESWITGRTPANGRPTAYVCRGQACSLPVTQPDALQSAARSI